MSGVRDCRGPNRLWKQVGILLSQLPKGGFVIRALTVLLLCMAPTACKAPGKVPGPASPVQPPDPPPGHFSVRDHTLANGLRLLVTPRPGPPTVSFVVQYPIGSVNEAPGTTGMSHFLEHMLFKGTTSVGTRDFQAESPLLRQMDVLYDSILVAEGSDSPDTTRIAGLWERLRRTEERASQLVRGNEFSDILSRNGARSLNAATSIEATTYFVELPSNRAELWFMMEADRMRNPVFREFFTEREVIAEERRMRLENSPGGLLRQAHLGAAFQVHPYGTPVIGRLPDIQKLSRPGMRSYFRRFYGPNNAVVSIVGDLDPDQMVQWAEDYFGSIPPGGEAQPVGIDEPEQTGERRVEVVYDAEPAVRIGWKIPSIHHEDTSTLAMLASLLTGGRRSRIFRRLVLEERIASQVTSFTGPGQLYPGLFVIEAYPISPHGTAEIEAVVYQELEKLASEAPEAAELQRVRNGLEATEVRRLVSNLGLALQIANSATIFGTWEANFSYSRGLRDVEPEDIRRVVSRYFRKDLRTVATLVKPSGPGEGEGP